MLTNILYLILSLSAMVLGFGLLYWMLSKAIPQEDEERPVIRLHGRNSGLMIVLAMGFIGLFQSVHYFCLVFSISR